MCTSMSVWEGLLALALVAIGYTGNGLYLAFCVFCLLFPFLLLVLAVNPLRVHEVNTHIRENPDKEKYSPATPPGQSLFCLPFFAYQSLKPNMAVPTMR